MPLSKHAEPLSKVDHVDLRDASQNSAQQRPTASVSSDLIILRQTLEVPRPRQQLSVAAYRLLRNLSFDVETSARPVASLSLDGSGSDEE